MQKTKEQLRKDLENKILGIELMVKSAKECPLESDERIEMSRNIANSLRSILYGDAKNNYYNLIKRCGLDDKLLFPCYDIKNSFNLFANYNLLSFQIKNKDVSVIINDDVYRDKVFYSFYLTFDSWLNEIIIDTKTKNIEPISRILLIKIISDTQGAHVDNEVENHVYEMSKTDLLPIHVEDGVPEPVDLEAKASSIIAETIIAIAEELLISFRKFNNTKISLFSIEKYQGAIHFFPCSDRRFRLYKFSIVHENSKTYNSNSHFECSIYCNTAHSYHIKTSHMNYYSCILDAKKIAEGELLGKSLYGSYNY